jgi:mycofactocin precursor
MTLPTAAPVSTSTTETTTAEPELVAEDLIEEVSIDGMCGVY